MAPGSTRAPSPLRGPRRGSPFGFVNVPTIGFGLGCTGGVAVDALYGGSLVFDVVLP